MAHSFQKGDRVRIREIPDSVKEHREKFPETFALFEKAAGKPLTIRDFNIHGHPELWLTDEGEESLTIGDHSIWVEPEYLELQESGEE